MVKENCLAIVSNAQSIDSILRLTAKFPYDAMVICCRI